MKHLLRLTTIVAIVLAAVSCEKKSETAEPWLAVTSNNISGIWKLAEWNGNKPAEGTYVYMEITRSDKEFTIYDNLNTFSAHKTTGRYNIVEDDVLGSVIRGMYDHGKGDWSHRYVIRNLTKESMTWIATDDATNISVYVRCTEIPAEILAETASVEEK